MPSNSKTVKEHLIAHEKHAFVRASLFTVLFGLPLLLWSLKTVTQREAAHTVETQKSYISYLLLSNNFVETQRNINTIAYSESIREVALKADDGKIIASSVPKSSMSIPIGNDSVKISVSGGPSYTVVWTYQISWSVILMVFLPVLFVGLCIALFMRSELGKIGKTLSHPLELISTTFRGISKVQTDLKVEGLISSGFSEIDVLEHEFSQLFQRLNAAEKRVVILAQQEALNKVAAQVAHDIRSPLSSLNILASDAMLADEKKAVFQSAISRINEIANELLATGKNFNGDIALEIKPVNISKIVEEIVLEKKTQFHDNAKITFEVNIDGTEAAWSRVHAGDFARIFSNLVNNSIEALIDGSGKIMVGVRIYPDTVSIFIQDNGRGMTADTIAQLGQNQKFSQGKDITTTGSGSGLGTYHAFNKVREWGGKIEVFSKIDEGTVFNIQLAKEKS
ncbi:hypothetical protein CIK05_15755 [Bdellovibrio sp. qaytius]|nr:hypothetical protein CIK05_15755 [Bdellovibrio sp. qaytius]